MVDVTVIDLMRHGEPVGGRRYRGQIDDPLSDKGWQQMESAVTGQKPWQAIVTSPLQRCKDFAVKLAQQCQIPVDVEDRFKEIGFGIWEGRTPDELRRENPEVLSRYYHDPISNRPDGAEASSAFIDRVALGWAGLQTKYVNHHVLVVAHAGVIRAIISQVIEMPIRNMFRLQIDNASISRISIDRERPPTLVFHNGRL